MADEKRSPSSEVVIVASPDVSAHVRALLDKDGIRATEANDILHAVDMANAARSAILLAERARDREEALEIPGVRASVDVLSPAGFGHALLDGALGRGQVVGFAQDTLHLLGLVVERATGGPAIVSQAAQLAELTARRLRLPRLEVETATTAAILVALGPRLAKLLTGADPSPGASGGLSKEVAGALAAASMLRSPWGLESAIGAVEERWDGKGRPRGMAGHAIPIGARVGAVVRSFVQAVAAGRDRGAIVQAMTASRGTELDPTVLDAFFRAVRDAEYVERISESQGDAPVIAVVDADASALAVAELRLTAAGFTVKTFLDGKSAEEAIEKDPPSAVISEIVVPRLDGFSLLLKLRRSEKTKAIPFTFATSTADKLTTTKALKLGAQDVVAKPVNFDILVAKLRESAKTRAPAAGAATATKGLQGDLAELALTDLIQVVGFGRRTVTIHVKAKDGEGSIAFELGQPIAASLGAKKGKDAFIAIVALREGKFAVEPSVRVAERDLNGSLDALLLEAARRMDEGSRQV